MAEISILAFVILLLLVLNAVYVAAEFAIIAVPRTLLEQEKDHKWARHLLAIVGDTALQDRYIATAQVGITLASLGLGMYGEHTLAALLIPHLAQLGDLQEPAAHGVATGTALLFLTFWHIVLGEMIPKSLALQHPMSTARWLAHPMRMSGLILAPFVFVLNHLGNLILKLLRLPISTEVSFVYSPAELKMAFEESRQGGALEADEHKMLTRMLEFGEWTVRQVMTPRTSMVGIPAETSLTQAVNVVRQHGYTRYPVWSEDQDHVVGVLHLKHMVGELLAGRRDRPLVEMVQEAVFVPANVHLDRALSQLQTTQRHLAIVIDEQGGTVGLVTVEDLAEKVLGELHDEFDGEERPAAVEQDGAWVVRGDMALRDLETLLEQCLNAGRIHTVSGLVLHQIGKPPIPGDRVEWNDLLFTVLEVRAFMPALCRLERKPQAGGQSDLAHQNSSQNPAIRST